MCMWFCLVLGLWTPQLVPRLRAKGPERGPPQSAFLLGLGAECAACGNSWQECLQIGLWKQLWRSLSGRGPDLLRGPTGQRQNPARPLPLASLAQTLLASRVTAQCRDKLRGVCPDMPGRLPRLSTSRAYPLGLCLS